MNTRERTAMPQSLTADQVVGAAKDIGQAEFTRDDLAKKLGVEKRELKEGFRAARQSGRLEKVRDDEQGTGHFRLTGE
jgi:hypothetical protein